MEDWTQAPRNEQTRCKESSPAIHNGKENEPNEREGEHDDVKDTRRHNCLLDKRLTLWMRWGENEFFPGLFPV